MATSRRVVIDDTDDRIQYSGQWFTDQGNRDKIGNYGPTYKHTSHGTYRNDSLSFPFRGTSITLMGTAHFFRLEDGTRWDPSWECFVDGTSIGSTKPSGMVENNWVLCEEMRLSDGPHTFSVNVTTAGTTFWVDYLMFTPSPSDSFDEAVLKVQNYDPSITVDSSWEALSDIGNMTTVKGSQATVKFVGKSVTWVGTVPWDQNHARASGSFSIDGGSPTSFQLDGIPADGRNTLFNQPFFTTPDLTPGPHTLLVTYEGADEPATPLSLDFLYVTKASTHQATPSTVPGASPSTTQGTTSNTAPNTITGTTLSSILSSILGTSNSKTLGTTLGMTPSTTLNTTPTTTSSTIPSASATSAGSNARNPKSSAPVGAIVGSVIGGLCLVALIIILFLWWRRLQHRESTETTSAETGGRTTTEVTPFMLLHPSVPDAASSASKFRAASPLPLSSSLRPTQPNESSDRLPNTHPNNTSSNNRGPGGSAVVEIRFRELLKAQAIMHPIHRVLRQDSGLRSTTQEGSTVGDVPPVYTMA